MICLNSVIERIVWSRTMTLHVLRVDAGRHELRGRDDDRVALLGVDEVVELGLALGVVPGDAHDVLAVLGAEVGVLVHERLAHPLGVVDVLAEDDRLVVPVVAARNSVTFLATSSVRFSSTSVRSKSRWL
jgi:hypothetical protein